VSEWQDTCDAPNWDIIRVRYKDGVESTGEFFMTDLGAEFFDEHLNRDDWPVEWMPLDE
jgi:hypothetical protein